VKHHFFLFLLFAFFTFLLIPSHACFLLSLCAAVLYFPRRYLSIEGHSDMSVSGARREIIRILNEETMRVGLDSTSSRYSVV
jgi:hypothetical protein